MQSLNHTSAYRQAVGNNRVLSVIVVVQFVAILALCGVVSLAFPLKSTEYLVYEFSSDGNTFVRINRADSTISTDYALVRTLLRAYINNRETINHTDDARRFSAVMAMSDSKVATQFKALLETLNYDSNIKRAIMINSDNPIGGFDSRIHQIHFTTTDTNLNSKQITKQKWTATLKYGWAEQYRKVDDIHFNPLGLVIYEYAISERKE